MYFLFLGFVFKQMSCLLAVVSFFMYRFYQRIENLCDLRTKSIFPLLFFFNFLFIRASDNVTTHSASSILPVSLPNYNPHCQHSASPASPPLCTSPPLRNRYGQIKIPSMVISLCFYYFFIFYFVN
jgi:hypothetical protein